MMRIILIFVFALMLTSCNSDTDELINKESLTDGLVELGVKYGLEDRQFLDIYKAASDCPTPVYFDAHGNGGSTTMPSSIIEGLNNQGISVIAWESLTSVNSPSEVETGWNDAELMFQWVIDNAETYNFDTSNFIKFVNCKVFNDAFSAFLSKIKYRRKIKY